MHHDEDAELGKAHRRDGQSCSVNIEGINDERDSVPILIEIRRCWPLIKAEIEELLRKPPGA
jgi:hypothetical protein